MTIGIDPVFPLPEPTFLFVHDLTIVQTGASPTEGNVTVDSEGHWDYNGASPTASFDVRGYLTGPDAKEFDRAASRGEVLDAVALVPRDTVLTTHDQLLAAGVNTYMDGLYTITGVRPNPSHIRILLSRVTGAQGGP